MTVSSQESAMSGQEGIAATRGVLESLGLPRRDPGELPSSPSRFSDGAQWRVEIPSVEGPAPLRAVLDEATCRHVPVHRVSQGSGLMMLTRSETEEMVALGRAWGVEVSLFVGPRALWDVGVQATTPSGRVVSGSLRGADQLVYAVEDVRRGCELGVRSVLVADIGLLHVLGVMKERGDLPGDLVLKVSISLPVCNPATARVVEDLGATTINLPVDLTLAQIAGIRAAVSLPLDVYVEAADDFGGVVRHYEVAELTRVAAPVHLKFTVRNAPGIYPSGGHLAGVAEATARERVRRAELGLSILERYYPEATTTAAATVTGRGPGD